MGGGVPQKISTFFASVLYQYTKMNLQTIQVQIHCCFPTVNLMKSGA